MQDYISDSIGHIGEALTGPFQLLRSEANPEVPPEIMQVGTMREAIINAAAYATGLAESHESWLEVIEEETRMSAEATVGAVATTPETTTEAVAPVVDIQTKQPVAPAVVATPDPLLNTDGTINLKEAQRRVEAA